MLLTTIEEENFHRKAKLQHKQLKDDLRYANQVAMLFTIAVITLVIASGLIKFNNIIF